MIRNRFQSPVPYAQVAVLMMVRLAEPCEYPPERGHSAPPFYSNVIMGKEFPPSF